jgi:DNA polymerase-3 subunit epsilon
VRPAAERFKSASTERGSDVSLACEYAVVDVETANPARRSICQIGLVIMRGTQEIAAHSWFVDHQGPMTLTWIHGITEEMLDGAPTFAELYPGLLQIIAGRPIVSHSQFDPQAFRAATAHNDLPEIEGPWIDSMDMVRHVKDMPRPQSSGLADICEA